MTERHCSYCMYQSRLKYFSIIRIVDEFYSAVRAHLFIEMAFIYLFALFIPVLYQFDHLIIFVFRVFFYR